MVDVTVRNFDMICGQIESLLASSSCCFVSIDLEFTGLPGDSNENGRFINKNDLPSQRYMKYRELIDNFCMIQFGICLWKYDKLSCKITSYPFNFWTFPQYLNSTFLSQPSALKFLRENGFDFNKLIDEGIDFLSIDQEKSERKYHDKKQQEKKQRIKQRKENKQIIEPKTERDIQFIQEIEEELMKFINNKEEILELGLINGFRRLLIFQLIETKYSESLIAFKQIMNNDDNNNNNKYYKKIAIKKISNMDSKKEIENKQKKQIEKKWNDNILKSIGVRKIFDMICLYKIPILFHNGFLDSMYLFRSFIGSLPLDPCKFTKRLNEYLPFIYDTKYMMQILFKRTKMIQNSSLCNCFQFFINNDNKQNDDDDDDDDEKNNKYNDINNILNIQVCIEMNENKERNKKKEKEYLSSKNGSFHEAGYDAFCTGYIFAKIGEYLLNNNNNNNNNDNNKNLYDIKNELHSNDYDKMMTLSHYVNRLNLSYTFCKHFYVGNKYKIDDKFNFNLKYNGNNQDDDDNKNDDIYNGVLCGVDYNAINNEWYKMFYCKFNDNDETIKNTKLIIDVFILKFLKQYISESNRIMIYKYKGNTEANIRINNVSQKEYNEIVKGFTSKQPNNLIFSKYVDYKSKELRECYKKIMAKK